MNTGFWKGKKVFVTGHTGFKGSWLVLWLHVLGSDVTGYSLDPPTEPSLFELANLSNITTSITGDIRDLSRLSESLNQAAPEIIIHLAAQTIVKYSYQNPIETYSTNVLGTVNLLEVVRQMERPCVVVNVTSDKCYENNGSLWGYRENEALGGHDPYSNSKACAELITSSFRRSYFSSHNAADPKVFVATARAGNVIGGGDWTPDQLVPDTIRAFLDGDRVRLRNPCAIRPWQFVLEPLSGYLSLAEHLYHRGGEFAEAWNFGPYEDGEQKPVSWIVETVSEQWGTGAGWEQDMGTRFYEAASLRLDSSKARSRLKWSPKLRLHDAISWTVDWYKGYQAGQDIRLLTEAQIRRYENLPVLKVSF